MYLLICAVNSYLYDISMEFVFCFVLIIVLRPGKQFFSHVETEPPIPGYYQYFLGSKISMECKVYMNSSLPPYQNIMQSSVVILGI